MVGTFPRAARADRTIRLNTPFLCAQEFHNRVRSPRDGLQFEFQIFNFPSVSGELASEVTASHLKLSLRVLQLPEVST